MGKSGNGRESGFGSITTRECSSGRFGGRGGGGVECLNLFGLLFSLSPPPPIYDEPSDYQDEKSDSAKHPTHNRSDRNLWFPSFC